MCVSSYTCWIRGGLAPFVLSRAPPFGIRAIVALAFIMIVFFMSIRRRKKSLKPRYEAKTHPVVSCAYIFYSKYKPGHNEGRQVNCIHYVCWRKAKSIFKVNKKQFNRLIIIGKTVSFVCQGLLKVQIIIFGTHACTNFINSYAKKACKASLKCRMQN